MCPTLCILSVTFLAAQAPEPIPVYPRTYPAQPAPATSAPATSAPATSAPATGTGVWYDGDHGLAPCSCSDSCCTDGHCEDDHCCPERPGFFSRMRGKLTGMFRRHCEEECNVCCGHEGPDCGGVACCACCPHCEDDHCCAERPGLLSRLRDKVSGLFHHCDDEPVYGGCGEEACCGVACCAHGGEVGPACSCSHGYVPLPGPPATPQPVQKMPTGYTAPTGPSRILPQPVRDPTPQLQDHLDVPSQPVDKKADDAPLKIMSLWTPEPAGRALNQASPARYETTLRTPIRRTLVDKVGHAADYSWIAGQLERVGGRCILHYAPETADRFRGSFVLASNADLTRFQDGDLVLVQGRVANPERGAQGPLYLAVSVFRIEH